MAILTLSIFLLTGALLIVGEALIEFKEKFGGLLR